MQRDVTRALGIVKDVQRRAVSNGNTYDASQLQRVATILVSIDARTGRRDPTVRSGKRKPAESAEAQARRMLGRIGVPHPERYSAGDLVELANLIHNTNKAPAPAPRADGPGGEALLDILARRKAPAKAAKKAPAKSSRKSTAKKIVRGILRPGTPR